MNYFFHNLLHIVCSFIAGLITGFVSFVIGLGIMIFIWGEWNRFSVSFALGMVTGLLLFLGVLSGMVCLLF